MRIEQNSLSSTPSADVLLHVAQLPSILRDFRRLSNDLAATMELAKTRLLKSHSPPILFQNQISISQELCTFKSLRVGNRHTAAFRTTQVRSLPVSSPAGVMPSVTSIPRQNSGFRSWHLEKLSDSCLCIIALGRGLRRSCEVPHKSQQVEK